MTSEVLIPEIPMPEFDQLADLYWQLGVMQSPSQLQGYLVGRLSSGDGLDVDPWVTQASTYIDAVQAPGEEGSALLAALFTATSLGLISDDMKFQLLLPDDEVEINLRVDALGQWCQGFMAGFAEGGKRVQKQLGQQQYTQDVSEAISDIAAISQISLTEEDVAEHSEQQFFELTEYLRLAAVTIYLDCRREAEVVESSQSAKVKQTADESSTTSPSALFGANKKNLH